MQDQTPQPAIGEVIQEHPSRLPEKHRTSLVPPKAFIPGRHHGGSGCYAGDIHGKTSRTLPERIWMTKQSHPRRPSIAGQLLLVALCCLGCDLPKSRPANTQTQAETKPAGRCVPCAEGLRCRTSAQPPCVPEPGRCFVNQECGKQEICWRHGKHPVGYCVKRLN